MVRPELIDELYDAARTSSEKLAPLLSAETFDAVTLSTALEWAARFDQPACVTLLFEHGAKDSKQRALMLAVGDVETLKVFGDVANERPDGRSLLHLTENEQVVRWLLEHGADVDAVDNYGITPLHIAVFHGRLKIAKALVNAGARSDLPALGENYRTQPGETANDLATRLAPQGPAWKKIAALLR